MIIPNDGKNEVPEQLRICRLGKKKGIEDIIDQMENHHYMIHYLS